MFLVWYLLYSFIFITLKIIFLVLKLFKININLFSVNLSNFINSFFFYNSNETFINSEDLRKNTNNKILFKNLYSEFNFFNLKLNDFNKTQDLLIANNLLTFSAINNFELKLLTFFSISNLPNDVYVDKILLSNQLNFKFSKLNSTENILNNYKNLNIYNLYKGFTKYSLNIVSNFKEKINLIWTVKYAPSNFIKYIDYKNLNQYTVLYLRKNKVFNKGRYSRNRQYYRTGVYWCLYVNIIAVVGIYFWFYRFTMNFGYLWWLLYLFIASFILPKAIKYRLYNLITLKNSLYLDLLWLSFIFINIFNFCENIINIFKAWFLQYFDNQYFFNNNKSLTFNSLFKVLLNIFSFNRSINIFYIWEYNNINYYGTALINSSNFLFERLKLSISQFFSFFFK